MIQEDVRQLSHAGVTLNILEKRPNYTITQKAKKLKEGAGNSGG